MSEGFALGRRNFLRGLTTSGLLLTALPDFARDDTQGEPAAEQPDLVPVPIFAAYLRGVQYRKLAPEFVRGLQVGDPIDLVREPYNHYDKQAIAAYAAGEHLGYLPREDNVVLSRLLDSGLPLSCALVVVDAARQPWHQLAVTLDLLYPQHPQVLVQAREEPLVVLGAPRGPSPQENSPRVQRFGPRPMREPYSFRFDLVPRPDELTQDEELQRALVIAVSAGVFPRPRKSDGPAPKPTESDADRPTPKPATAAADRPTPKPTTAAADRLAPKPATAAADRLAPKRATAAADRLAPKPATAAADESAPRSTESDADRPTPKPDLEEIKEAIHKLTADLGKLGQTQRRNLLDDIAIGGGGGPLDELRVGESSNALQELLSALRSGELPG